MSDPIVKGQSNVPVGQKFIRPEHKDDNEVWSLPRVEDQDVQTDESTNALGFKRNWRYEPPEETEVEEPVPLTAQEIEEIRQAAYEEGFNQGKEEGFAKGYDEGKEKGHVDGTEQGHQEGLASGQEAGKAIVDEQAAQFNLLTEQLHKPIALVEKNVEQQLLQLVVKLTEAVTLQEAQTNPDILYGALEAGIKALPSQDANTQIMLNPEDIKLIEAQFGSDHIQQQGWRLLAAPQIERGSCQIENSISNIDLRMKSRLKEVLDSFLQEAMHQ